MRDTIDLALARAIASELTTLESRASLDWGLDEVDAKERTGVCVTLVRADGPSLYLDTFMGGTGRLEISGRYPRTENGHYYSPGKDERVTITVAASRGAHAIARDILRKVLPVYLPAYVMARAYVDRQERDTAQRRTDLARLARALRTKVNEHAKDYRQDVELVSCANELGHYTIARLHTHDGASSVHLKISDLSLEQVEAIGRYLAGGELASLVSDFKTDESDEATRQRLDS